MAEALKIVCYFLQTLKSAVTSTGTVTNEMTYDVARRSRGVSKKLN